MVEYILFLRLYLPCETLIKEPLFIFYPIINEIIQYFLVDELDKCFHNLAKFVAATDAKVCIVCLYKK